jgi:hypothetical protein
VLTQLIAAHSDANVCTICTIDRIRKCFEKCCGYETQGPGEGHLAGDSHDRAVRQRHSKRRFRRRGLGVLIIGVLNNGMVLLSVPTFYQTIANGSLLLMAVIVDQLQKRPGRMAAES